MTIKSKPELKNQKFWTVFKEIKSLRDEIIHLKSSGKTYVEQYNPVFISLIDLEAEDAFKEIINLINYLEPKMLN